MIDSSSRTYQLASRYYLINLEIHLWASDEVVEPLRDDGVLGVRHQTLAQQVLDEAVPGAGNVGGFKMLVLRDRQCLGRAC